MSIKEDIQFAFQKKNNAHTQVIIINVLVFILINALLIFSNLFKAPILQKIAIVVFQIPSDYKLFLTRFWTIFTYAFTHIDFFHILFNMLWLYWFGRLFVDFLGDRRLYNLYILGGIAGGILYIVSYNHIPGLVERGNGLMIGASASVSAIVVGIATLTPNYRFNLFLLGSISIKYMAAFVVITSFFNISGSNAGGNIAHLGGALIGYVYVAMLQKGTDLGRPLSYLYDFIERIFTKKSKLRVSYKSAKTNTPKNGGKHKPSQHEIDLILDKIAESGYESLSKEEKDKLFNASKE